MIGASTGVPARAFLQQNILARQIPSLTKAAGNNDSMTILMVVARLDRGGENSQHSREVATIMRKNRSVKEPSIFGLQTVNRFSLSGSPNCNLLEPENGLHTR
jgi:hypothetical protein